jgi:hypothetical protein
MCLSVGERCPSGPHDPWFWASVQLFPGGLPRVARVASGRSMTGVPRAAAPSGACGAGLAMAGLLTQAAAGALHPVPPATCPLERAAEALNSLARRQVTGKLALLP